MTEFKIINISWHSNCCRGYTHNIDRCSFCQKELNLSHPRQLCRMFYENDQYYIDFVHAFGLYETQVYLQKKTSFFTKFEYYIGPEEMQEVLLFL